jgi:hypothetical protein
MRLTSQQYADYLARQVDKLGWPAPSDKDAPECKLHDRILQECCARQWIGLHSRMDRRTGRTLGEFDFVILADGGRVFFIECKSAKGKLSTQQQALHAWAEKLGHKVHTVRTFVEFLEVVK